MDVLGVVAGEKPWHSCTKHAWIATKVIATTAAIILGKGIVIRLQIFETLPIASLDSTKQNFSFAFCLGRWTMMLCFFGDCCNKDGTFEQPVIGLLNCFGFLPNSVDLALG